MVHIYYAMLLSHKKEWNHATCSNMNGSKDYHTKWSKPDRERQIPYDVTYMWNLNYDTSDLYKPEIVSHRKWTYGYQREKGRGIN